MLSYSSSSPPSSSKSVAANKDALLAPGFRFHPTDEEIVSYYLKRKICGIPLRFDSISEIDIYRFEPWDLPSKPNSNLSLFLPHNPWFFIFIFYINFILYALSDFGSIQNYLYFVLIRFLWGLGDPNSNLLSTLLLFHDFIVIWFCLGLLFIGVWFDFGLICFSLGFHGWYQFWYPLYHSSLSWFYGN